MTNAITVQASKYFDFLAGIGLDYDEKAVHRMNWRHAHIIVPIEDEIRGARILDLGSHDGRWPCAYADAGAREVIGIEGRAELVEEFAAFPAANKDRVKLRVGDFVDGMDALIAAGETFDIVSCLGVYYHTMQHYRMMCQMAMLKPKLIIIDSEFARSEDAVILMSRENPVKRLNSTEQFKGQDFVPVGFPSAQAARLMAKSVGYDMKIVNWNVPEDQRLGVKDYYDRFENRVRLTAVLRPFPKNASQ